MRIGRDKAAEEEEEENQFVFTEMTEKKIQSEKTFELKGDMLLLSIGITRIGCQHLI